MSAPARATSCCRPPRHRRARWRWASTCTRRSLRWPGAWANGSSETRRTSILPHWPEWPTTLANSAAPFKLCSSSTPITTCTGEAIWSRLLFEIIVSSWKCSRGSARPIWCSPVRWRSLIARRSSGTRLEVAQRAITRERRSNMSPGTTSMCSKSDTWIGIASDLFSCWQGWEPETEPTQA